MVVCFHGFVWLLLVDGGGVVTSGNFFLFDSLEWVVGLCGT